MNDEEGYAESGHSCNIGRLGHCSVSVSHWIWSSYGLSVYQTVFVEWRLRWSSQHHCSWRSNRRPSWHPERSFFEWNLSD